MTRFYRGIKKLAGILTKEQTEILETALLSMVPVLLNKALGFLFGLIAASYFGNKSVDWQHFLLANSIPDLLTNVIIAGSIGAIVIPTLISCKKERDIKAFFRLYSSILNISIVVLSVISIFIAIFADVIFPVVLKTIIHVSPDQYPNASEMQQIINMMRVLLIPQIILGVSTFISSGLNVYNRFLIPQLAPLFFNLGRILGILILYPLMGNNIWAIIIGVIVGAFLHIGIQLPMARAVGLRYTLAFDFKDKYFLEIIRVGIPRFFSLALENIALTVNDLLAFGIRGGISALTFAEQISTFVPNVFAFTFAMASFPKLSEHFSEKNFDKVRYIVIKSLNEMLFLVVPVVITILVLRVPIVRLIFGSMPGTALDLEDTYQIAWVLMLFAIGHIFICGKWFLYRVYYAAKDTRTPLFTSIVSFVISILTAVLFTNLFSHNKNFAISDTVITLENFLTRGDHAAAAGGVAFGLSIGYIIEFLLLVLVFNKRNFSLGVKKLFLTTGKKLIAGAVMFIVMYGMYRLWNSFSYIFPESGNPGFTGSTTLNLLILTGVTAVTSAFVYYLVCLLLKVEELKILKRYLNPVFKIGGIKIS